MAFHLYSASMIRQTDDEISLQLTGAGIPHTVTGKPENRSGVVVVSLASVESEDGSPIQVRPAEKIFYDPQAGKASYDHDTLVS